ncbi:WD40/YVTN/BNR-like repeat-containing protein [Micromonospora sp. GCM10011542]|uniref:WD40/YVTN/BNR-like repeat-containing protein n=1 Tax=Micromonospora sp. GCM10011542 TaxID=3317337 RepID=UPI003606171D
MHLKTMKRTLLALGLTTALSGVAAVPASAETGTSNTVSAAQWQSIGPNASGGHLAFTPAMPSRVYVLPDRGWRVHRSDDHGLTWLPQAKFEIPDARGLRLAADPHDPDVVYVAGTVAGSWEGFLLRSDDAGRTFDPVLNSPTQISDVVVSPTGQYVFAAGDAGVFASSDQGLHWLELPGSPSGATRLALEGQDLFVGTRNGIYLVENALGNAGPAQRLSVPGDLSVEMLSVRGSVLVASNQATGAVMSTDRGRSWAKLSGPWGADDSVLYTGLTATGELQVQTIANTADGTGKRNLWVTSDLGRTWTPKPKATSSVDAYTDTGSFPDRPYEQVVAAGGAGIYTTRDSTRFQRIGVPDAQVNTLAVSGSALVAGTAVAGSYRSTAPLAENLQPGYQEWGWTGQVTNIFGNEIHALATVKGQSGGMLRTRGGLCGGDCFALERSANGGASWRTLDVVPGVSWSLAVDPRDPSTIYAASMHPAVGVYASQDGGATLTLHQFPEMQGVESVTVDPRADGALWIGDLTGLYRSTDSGATAVKVFDGEVVRVAVDPADPNHIVAVGTNMIKVSHDGGASFSDADIPGLVYNDVTFAPDGTMFAASRDMYEPGQGVFRSDDGGVHWSNAFSAQLVDPDVRSVLVSPDGHWLFAGTGSSVYRLALR